jgi:hypothetical protein
VAANLCLRGQDTYGCFPVHSSVALNHATVDGDTVKVQGLTSLFDLGEENFTAARREILFPCNTSSS